MTVEACYRWRVGPIPAGQRVVQVYGWLFDATGRVLVQDLGDGKWNLPGGTPEYHDRGDLMVTLAREAMEESQVSICSLVHLGYEECRRDGQPVALARMAGRIRTFWPSRPDSDTGRQSGRLLTSLHDAATRLAWGVSGSLQAAAAEQVAAQRWQLPIWEPSAASAYRS
ncbi:NUDIX hydrolase [Nocardia terpenica]|uniref:NUDIX hydrolase n=1 Tax=Nocardia terpenica TaxID=455432 RepID=UPI002FE13C07